MTKTELIPGVPARLGLALGVYTAGVDGVPGTNAQSRSIRSARIAENPPKIIQNPDDGVDGMLADQLLNFLSCAAFVSGNDRRLSKVISSWKQPTGRLRLDHREYE